MSENVVHFTDATFEDDVVKSSEPVLIDFWAVWCGPCRMIAPIIEELADEYAGKVKIGKLDVDNNPQSAFGINHGTGFQKEVGADDVDAVGCAAVCVGNRQTYRSSRSDYHIG